MIGADDLDFTGQDAFKDLLLHRHTPQRRIHLDSVAMDLVIIPIEEHVMPCNLADDMEVDLVLLLLQEIDSLRIGDMGDIESPPEVVLGSKGKLLIDLN